jgi:hypothetical protein
MANLANIIAHLKDDAERQRHLARMQQLRNEMAAYDMLRVATVLQGGVSSNRIKGTMPFMIGNASRGLGTVAMANPLVTHTIFVPAAPPSRPPSRRRRSRR